MFMSGPETESLRLSAWNGDERADGVVTRTPECAVHPTTASAPTKVASRHFLEVASTLLQKEGNLLLLNASHRR